jgi:hypothetical protein
MGFYIKKGIGMGPFRLNISKSGLGVSAGVKGFRISTGPRGTQLNAGRGGLYFRKSLSPQQGLPTLEGAMPGDGENMGLNWAKVRLWPLFLVVALGICVLIFLK